MLRMMVFWAFSLFFALSAQAKDPSVEVTVEVVDYQGMPLTTAAVHQPLERLTHRVNSKTGQWSNRVLYLPTGHELPILPNMKLTFEVSAPGYANIEVEHLVRRRNNTLTVTMDRRLSIYCD